MAKGTMCPRILICRTQPLISSPTPSPTTPSGFWSNVGTAQRNSRPCPSSTAAAPPPPRPAADSAIRTDLGGCRSNHARQSVTASVMPPSFMPRSKNLLPNYSEEPSHSQFEIYLKNKILEKKKQSGEGPKKPPPHRATMRCAHSATECTTCTNML